ncbi:MAG: T9SS type A sorting domain-containing protein, partial [Bacteroidota bacterium]
LHAVSVKDANGEVVNFDLVVGEGNYYAPRYTKSRLNASCSTCTNGTAKVTLKNGRKPMTITWNTDPPVQGNQITGCKPGYYSFVVTDGCGNSYTDSILVSYTGAVGIAEMAAGEFNLFPNPAGDQIQVSFAAAAEIQSVKIINILGSVAMTQPVNGSATLITLSTAGLTPGVYFVELTDKMNGRKSIQFIKL